MITWIQRYFHKHIRLVFLLILAAMAVPLVVVFSPSSGVSGAKNRIKERPFFNVNLGSEEQANRLFSDGSLSMQLKAGYNALQSAQLQQYALQRVAGLAVADELHLPAPTADQIAKYVTSLRAFQNETGQFDQKRYTAFGDSLKTGKGLSTAEVNRVLRDDTRLEQLSKIVGGPGYVLPHDVRQQLIRGDSTWTVQVGTLSYATFNPTIPDSDVVLKKFYDENSFRYEVPVRPRLSYVEFKNQEFQPPVGPSEAEMRNFYLTNQASFPVPADASPVTTVPADNFLKVRAQVESAMKSTMSARLATKAASDLTVALYDRKLAGKLAANTPALTDFLAAQRRPAVAIPPFAPDTPPANLPWLANYADQISRLDEERFFSDPLQTPDGIIVLLWNETLPAYKPLFPEVRDRVAADHKEGEKRKLFSERGRVLRTLLQTAAKSGPTGFSTAAAAEKLEVKSYANFTLRQPPQDLPYPAVSALRTLEAGDVSEMMTTAEQGLFVHPQEKKLPDLSPASPRYAELQKQLMQFTASTNENSFLGDLVERELKKSEPATTP